MGGNFSKIRENINYIANVHTTSFSDFTFTNFVKNRNVVNDMLEELLLDGWTIVMSEISVGILVPSEHNIMKKEKPKINSDVNPDAMKVLIVISNNRYNTSGSGRRDKTGEVGE